MGSGAGLVALICDTGVLFAAQAPSEPAHDRCAALLEAASEPLTVPVPVFVELEWMVTRRRGPRAFAASFVATDDGSLRLVDLIAADWRRVRALCAQYADFPLGLVDASVVAVAERLREPKIASLDHRHFAAIRPRHVAALELLPS